MNKTVCLVGLLLIAPGAPAAQAQDSPERLEGLVARYEARSLHARHVDDSKIEVWPDSSGNGHDLTFAGKGLEARFHTRRLNDKPIVAARKRGAYLVHEPFELQDHTIFLVLRPGSRDRALFGSDTHPARGIVLFDDSRRHVYRTGAVGREVAPYTDLAKDSGEFGVTILARDRGRLRAWVDGAEVSSGYRLDAALRVGRLFRVVYSQFVDKDGNGMEIAEMLFYDRFLGRVERESVARYFFSRYGLAERAPGKDALKPRLADLRQAKDVELLWLGTDSAVNLNDPVIPAVDWTRRERVDEAFSHKAGEYDTEIHCTRDATLVRVYVALTLSAATPGSNVRVSLLKNRKVYHEDDTESGEFGGEGEDGKKTVELETTLFLDAGEYFEVVTQRLGSDGEIRIVPGSAILVAKAR